MARDVAPQLSPLLAGGRPDLQGVHRWLVDGERSGIGATAGSPGVTIRIAATDFADARVLVLDNRGQLLGSIRQATALTAPQSFDRATVPELVRLLPRALAGVVDPKRLSTVTQSGQLTIAVPIRDERSAVLGVLVFNGPVLFPIATILGSAAVLIVGSVLVLTVVVGLIGTAFGFLTAKRLTRRLRRATAVVATWGAGDFTRTIPDESADEIGHLSRQLNRMAAQLDELIATRQQLSAVNERNRLARDLHDSVKQQVFATSLHLGAAQVRWEHDPASARRSLATAFELTRQSQQELTSIIQMLRPVHLDAKGLRQSLADYVDRWQEQTGIAAEFEVRGNGPGTLPPLVEDAFFRVTQEALANAARHSRASRVEVRLTFADNQVSLAIEDDGHGFDGRASASGVGLASMRERVEAVAGTLRIAGSPSGTSVVAQAPLAPDEGP
jgi:NarL family two-component system sensor histidine kinase LiaS